MLMHSQVSAFLRRSVALTVVLGASFAVAVAQDQTTPAASQVAAEPTFSSSLSADDTAAQTDTAVSVKPASGAQIALNALHLNLFGNAMQYGGRQSYGRPRYRGSNTNADGSPKYDFYVGAGFTVPTQQTNVDNTISYGIQAGGGRMFNKSLGVNLEFDYDHFGLTNYAVSDYLYVNTGSTANTEGIGGSMHTLSLSLQPIYNIRSGEGLGVYVTGGVGFYHKVTNFTAPSEECSFIYGCYIYNASFDEYTSNAPGFDGGIGVTYKFSRFSSQSLYGEARYVYVDNSFRAGATDSNNYLTYGGYNYYPANSLHTSYMPIKFGLRF